MTIRFATFASAMLVAATVACASGTQTSGSAA
jgi:hypothetical protein